MQTSTSRESLLGASPARGSPFKSSMYASSPSPVPLSKDTTEGPRRTSSSFKHVKHNSLVTNSPFKQATSSSSSALGSPKHHSTGSTFARYDQSQNGEHHSSARRPVSFHGSPTHETHAPAPASTSSGSTRSYPHSNATTVVGANSRASDSVESGRATAERESTSRTASGAGPSPRPRQVSQQAEGVGLGISAKPRKPQGLVSSCSTNQSSPLKTSTVAATPSPEEEAGADRKGPLRFPSSEISDPRSMSGAAESPDARASAVRRPRQSLGLKALGKESLVSRSPFKVAAQDTAVRSKGPSPVAAGVAMLERGNETAPASYQNTHDSSSASKATSMTPTKRAFAPPREPNSKDDVFISPSSTKAGPTRYDQEDYEPSPAFECSASPTSRRPSNGSISSSPAPLGMASASPQRQRKSSLTQTMRSDISPSKLAASPTKPVLSHRSGRTPMKSSITSRRLRGPRSSSSLASGSPPGFDQAVRKVKSVTFRAVPDVKEFDSESLSSDDEHSHRRQHHRNEYADEDGDGGDDDDYYQHQTETRAGYYAEPEEARTYGHSIHDDLPDISPARFRASSQVETQPTQIVIHCSPASSTGTGYHRGMEPDDSFDADQEEEDGHDIAAESSPRDQYEDADFGTSENGHNSYLDSLVEDGYFSPPDRSNAVMETLIDTEAEKFDAPLPQVDNVMDASEVLVRPTQPSDSIGSISSLLALQLATPTFGTPLAVTTPVADHERYPFDEVDEHGVPYGRTHHAQREAEAHSHEAATRSFDKPVSQPALPSVPYTPGEPIIRSQDASQPALSRLHQLNSGAEVTQDGPLPDPFLTIQTATSVFEQSQPQETAASQRQEGDVPLGRSSHAERAKAARMFATQSLGLGMPRRPAFVQPYSRGLSENDSESGSEMESDGEAEEGWRHDADQRDSGRALTNVSDNHSLAIQSPLLDFTDFRAESPNKMTPSTLESEEIGRPLTPPHRPVAEKEDSPHHIPDLNFGADLSVTTMSLTSPERGRDSDEESKLQTAFKGVEDLLPSKTKEAESVGTVSTRSHQVRQRISKDAIRAMMEEKRAKGIYPTMGAEIANDVPSAASTPTGSRQSRPFLGQLRTKSAQEVLTESFTDNGGVAAPRSALERLVSEMSPFNAEDSLAQEFDRIQLAGAVPTNAAKSETSAKRIVSLTGQSGELLPGVFLQSPVCSPDLKRGTSIRKVSNGHTRSVSADDFTREAPLSPNRLAIRGLTSSTSGMFSALEDELEKIAAETIVASADDKIKHSRAGDINEGGAWRQLRKPSDINEYAKELKALKAKAQKPGQAVGTIFVKILGIESLAVPLPSEQTAFCVTLDNGIDYIRTTYNRLKEGARVNQEFALMEHPDFEFTLGLEIRRDPHIVKMHQTNAKAFATTTSDIASILSTSKVSTGGAAFRNLFSSPRKQSARAAIEKARESARPVEDNIARFFGQADSTIGRSHIAFKPIAKNCEARLLEIRYPMFGYYQIPATLPQTPGGGPPTPAKPAQAVKKQIAKITLQIFHLPALPGLSPEQLPQSIDECLRGMRHHAWHQHEYHEGILTQRGGDCKIPRRRHFRILGGNLIASNEVTRKAVVSIDLKKVAAISDENSRGSDDFGVMPRSFRLDFKEGDPITLWADSDAAKKEWLEALGAIVGRVPMNPIWAEILVSRQRATRHKAA